MKLSGPCVSALVTTYLLAVRHGIFVKATLTDTAESSYLRSQKKEGLQLGDNTGQRSLNTLPAFPGAEGFGKFAVGGRGGT
eukprot:15363062-Ditylum_brightwellii.AAC.1